MVKTVAAMRVFEGAEALVEASKFPGFQRAGNGNVGFVIEQRGGDDTAFCTLRVRVLAGKAPWVGRVRCCNREHSGKNRHSFSDLLESARSVAGATEAAFVHKTFHHQRPLFPALLPILGDPPQRQAQDFRGQIGMTFSLDEEQKPAVVNDESQTPSPLLGTPAHPFFPLIEMRGRAAECKDRNPVPFPLYPSDASQEPTHLTRGVSRIRLNTTTHKHTTIE